MPTAKGINPFEPLGGAGVEVEVEHETMINETKARKMILFMCARLKIKYQMYKRQEIFLIVIF